jgi:DNA-binding transcriptional LysR family regulator
MFDWNDLKYLVALAEHGSALAAARALQVNASTVQRRLLELEERIGQPLVRRESTGYHLTDYGRELVPLARRVAEAVSGMELHIQAKRHELVGVIRVTCPEPLAHRITKMQLLDRFHARHPDLRVEWVMSDKYLDIAKGDADVALRSGDVPDSELVGRKVADSLWGVYASGQYLEQHGRPERIEDLRQHNIVGFDESMANHRMMTWLREVAPDASIVARNNSVLGLLYSVKAGVGIAALPMPLGNGEPELVQLFGPVPELTRMWRLLTRPEIRHTPRISAFFDFVLEEIEALRPVLTG